MSKAVKILTSSFVFTLALISSELCAYHSSARWFNFFERPEDYLYKKGGFVDVNAFYTQADSAFKRGGGATSIPELFGPYDLWNMLDATAQVDANLAAQVTEMLPTEVQDKRYLPLHFKVPSRVRSSGFTLRGSYGFSRKLTVGFWLPIISVIQQGSYQFDGLAFAKEWRSRTILDQTTGTRIVDRLDVARRALHDGLGFTSNYWTQSGLGDLDLYVRWNHLLDHQLMMRSADISLQFGVTVPTAKKGPLDRPMSVPLMGDGHWAFYFDVMPEFELKQDWRVLFMVSGACHLPKTQLRRLSVWQEPTNFSPLVGRVEVQPGLSTKYVAALIKEHVIDGLHAQVRYAYSRHGFDTWYDRRGDKSISSYLSRIPDGTITSKQIEDNQAYKQNLSKFRSHYLTLQLLYNTRDAERSWKLHPNFYAMYDLPINGSAICKTHQFSFGMELHF